MGSEYTCLRRTDWRIRRKPRFSVKVEGVGGMEVEIPRESSGVGGSVWRRDRIWPLGVGITY